PCAKRRRPGLPAVLMTGYAEEPASLAGQGAAGGRFDLLRKPARGTQVLSRISALLEMEAPPASLSGLPSRPLHSGQVAGRIVDGGSAQRAGRGMPSCPPACRHHPSGAGPDPPPGT
ncbi:MAG: hypothetical protein AB7K73_10985, partial [Gammaproteobacteria bacterium]